MMPRPQDIAPRSAAVPAPAGRRPPVLAGLGQDLRYALRMLRKSPGFTAVALLSLALGIGTNSAIFTVVDALILRSLPVRDADRLVVVDVKNGREDMNLFSYSAFRRLSGATSVCSGLVAVTRQFTAVVRTPSPERPAVPGRLATAPPAVPSAKPAVSGLPVAPASAPPSSAAPSGEVQETAVAELVSGNFFELLGASAAVGRAFTAAEDEVPGAHPVAVLSHGYWQRRFGRDAGVVGRTLVVNGAPLTVLGVMPPGFSGLYADMTPDVFLPLTVRDLVRYRGNTWTDGPNDAARPVWGQLNVHWLELVARRRPGVGLAQANAVLNTL